MKHGKMTDRFTPWTRVGNIVSNGAFTERVVAQSPHYHEKERALLGPGQR